MPKTATTKRFRPSHRLAAAQQVVVAEGHVGGGSPTSGTYTYAELPTKFNHIANSAFKGGREWKWSNIIDTALSK